MAAQRGAIEARPVSKEIDHYLVSDGDLRPKRTHLKRRLIEAGLKEDRCEECGIDEWRGKLISLPLHHVNGRGQDNRLEDLQILYPDCHSQPPNFGGRNRGRNRLTT